MDAFTLIIPVANGHLQPSEPQKAQVAAFLRSRKAVAVKFGKPVKPRSLKANAYYWLCLSAIASETGNDVQDLHAYFKEKFVIPRFITLGGKEIEVRRTTTDLSSAEFAEYVNKVSAHASAELGIAIPEPE